MANPQTLTNIVCTYILQSDSHIITNSLPSPKFPANSRINRCYYKIIKARSPTPTRCLICDIPDDSSIDCLHAPFTDTKNNQRSRQSHKKTNAGRYTNNKYTPIIVTDGTSGNLPHSIREIQCHGLGLRASIRHTFYALLLQSFHPPPLLVISSGSLDFGSYGEAMINNYHKNPEVFKQKYFKPLNDLIEFTNALGGKVLIATLIPRMGEQDQRKGKYLNQNLRRYLRDAFWGINKEFITLNTRYEEGCFLNITKYFTNHPRKRKRENEIEKGYSSPPLKFIKSAYTKDMVTPTIESNINTGFTLFNTALKISGLQTIEKNEYKQLLEDLPLT